MAIQITQGTQTNVFTKVATGGTEVQVVKLDVGSGTNLADFGGTIPTIGSVTRIVGGTIGIIADGTISSDARFIAGQIGDGYMFIKSSPSASFATVVSTGTSTLGTIIST